MLSGSTPSPAELRRPGRVPQYCRRRRSHAVPADTAVSAGGGSRVLGGTFHHVANVLPAPRRWRGALGELRHPRRRRRRGAGRVYLRRAVDEGGARRRGRAPKPGLLPRCSACGKHNAAARDRARQWPYLFRYLRGWARPRRLRRASAANVTDFDGLLTGLRTCSRRTPATRAAAPGSATSSSTSTRTPRAPGETSASRAARCGGGGGPVGAGCGRDMRSRSFPARRSRTCSTSRRATRARSTPR